MIDFDEIRKEVAIKHGLLLDESDPALVAVTLNKVLLRNYVEELHAQHEAQEEKFKKKLVDALDLTVQKSQRVGENIAKSGAELIAKRADEAFTEAINDGTRKLRKDWAFVKEDESWKRQVFINGWLAGAFAMVLPLVLLKLWAYI